MSFLSEETSGSAWRAMSEQPGSGTGGSSISPDVTSYRSAVEADTKNEDEEAVVEQSTFVESGARYAFVY